jgi:hypothetical protein
MTTRQKSGSTDVLTAHTVLLLTGSMLASSRACVMRAGDDRVELLRSTSRPAREP